MTKWLLRQMTELSSRKSLSRLTGAFAKSSASKRLIPRFAKLYRINLDEAELHPSAYRSLNDFFTRKLKPGSRLVHEAADSLVSPVDALITSAGPIADGTIVNIKGQDYTIDELLNSSPHAAAYRNGYHIVLYLSPTDYHRIHSPVNGTVVERSPIPGKVYPVNDFGLRHMIRVLSRNERLVTYIQHEYGSLALVKVGAMNVSSIQYVQPLCDKLKKGEELAYFEFGSTVVLLLEEGTYTPQERIQPGLKVKMGELLGRLHRTVESVIHS